MKHFIKKLILVNFLVVSSMASVIPAIASTHGEDSPVKNEQVALSTSNQQEKQRVLDVVHKYTQSVNVGDKQPELIEDLWEHSPDVSNINIRGHQKGFDDIKKNFYAPIFAVLKDRNLRMFTNEREPSVYIFDNTAVVEFYWELNGVTIDGNKPVHMFGRETHVMRKINGEWKLVHLHYSGMPVKGF